MPVTTNRYLALDGWRGIAALMIVVYRFEGESDFYYLPFIRNAYLFVDFFFVLSGFVIAHSYFDKLKTAPDLVAFMIRRFGRLWPLHAGLFVVLFLMEAARWVMGIRSGIGAEPFTGVRALGTIPVELSFLNGFHIYSQTGWNLPSWSIAAEFWVYLLFGFLCLLMRRMMIVLALVAIPSCLLLILKFSPTGMDVTFNYGLLRCVAGFFTGFLVNRLWVLLSLKAIGNFFQASLIEVISLVFMVTFVSLVDLGSWSVAAPLIFAPIVWIFAFEGGVVSRLLKFPASQWLGQHSYSIYMVAFLVEIIFSRSIIAVAHFMGFETTRSIRVESIETLVFDLGWRLANDLALALYVCIVLAVSWLTFRVLEVPGRSYFNGLAKRYRHQKAVKTAPAV